MLGIGTVELLFVLAFGVVGLMIPIAIIVLMLMIYTRLGSIESLLTEAVESGWLSESGDMEPWNEEIEGDWEGFYNEEDQGGGDADDQV